MIHEIFRLTRDECSREFGGNHETKKDLKKYSSEEGWINKKVENESYWDFCPKCAVKNDISIFPKYV